MNTKTVVLTGALALVVIGCVLVAGCTSVQQAQTSDPTSCPWVGYWTSEYKHPDDSVTAVSMAVKSDGTAEWLVVTDETWEKSGENTLTITNPANGRTYAYAYDSAADRLTQTVNSVTNVYTRQVPASGTASCPWVGYWTSRYKNPNDSVTVVSMAVKSDGTVKWAVINDETWEKSGEHTFTITNPVTGSSFEYVYDPAKDTLTETVTGITNVYTRMDPITGIWFHEGIESTSGKHAKISNVLKSDGTGKVFLAYDDGSMRVIDVVWKKDADGTYALSYGNGFNVTWTLDSDKKTVRTSVDSKTMQKKFADSLYYLSILGPWYDSENKWITFFNADGTGTTVKENGLAEDTIVFTWEVPEFGTFLLHFQNGTNPYGGNLAGQDKVWAYDRVNDTFTTHAGTILVRPSEAVGNLTFEKF